MQYSNIKYSDFLCVCILSDSIDTLFYLDNDCFVFCLNHFTITTVDGIFVTWENSRCWWQIASLFNLAKSVYAVFRLTFCYIWGCQFSMLVWYVCCLYSDSCEALLRAIPFVLLLRVVISGVFTEKKNIFTFAHHCFLRFKLLKINCHSV